MEKLQGLRAEVEFLTLGGSRVIRVVYRLRNLRPVEHACRLGFSITPSLGATARELTGIGEGITRRPTPWAGWMMERPWAGVTHEASGRTMLMIGQRPKVALEDYGQYGRILGFEDEARLAGDQVREFVFYLVAADSVAQAEEYLSLRAL